MPRLSIVSASWAPIEGGAEKQLRQVALGLVGRGWLISTVTRQAPPDLAPREVTGEVCVRRVAVASRLPSATLVIMSREWQAVRRQRPDITLASLISADSAAGLIAGAKLRVPRVLRLGGDAIEHLAAKPAGRLLARSFIDMSTMIVANASHLLDAVHHLRPKSRAKTCVLPNGVETMMRTEPSGNRTDSTRALYYTNSGLQKNDADFQALVEACPDVEFRVVGRPVGLRSLPNLAVEGWCDDLSDHFAWADVVINTSTVEGSPNFCVQALAAGRPVLGFANQGIIDLSAQAPADVTVVTMHDVATMANALKTAGWRSQVVRFTPPSLDDVTDRWDHLLRGLIARSRT